MPKASQKITEQPKPAIFDRYVGTEVLPQFVMSDGEAESLGLPSDAEAKAALIEKIRSFEKRGATHRSGDPKKGFGSAIACLKIARGAREPQMITDGVSTIVRPTILRRGTDTPFWKGFQLVFPDSLRAQGFRGVESVPSLESVHKSQTRVDLAAGYGKLVVAQSMAVAIERHPILEMYDTNPADHVVVTIEDLNPKDVHPVLQATNPSEIA